MALNIMKTSDRAGPSSSPARARGSARESRASSPRTARRSWSSRASRRGRSRGQGDRQRRASAIAADVTKLARHREDGEGGGRARTAASISSAPMPASFRRRRSRTCRRSNGTRSRHQPQGHVPRGQGVPALSQEVRRTAASSSPPRSPGRSPAFPAGRITAPRNPASSGSSGPRRSSSPNTGSPSTR